MPCSRVSPLPCTRPPSRCALSLSPIYSPNLFLHHCRHCVTRSRFHCRAQVDSMDLIFYAGVVMQFFAGLTTHMWRVCEAVHKKFVACPTFELAAVHVRDHIRNGPGSIDLDSSDEDEDDEKTRVSTRTRGTTAIKRLCPVVYILSQTYPWDFFVSHN